MLLIVMKRPFHRYIIHYCRLSIVFIIGLRIMMVGDRAPYSTHQASSKTKIDHPPSPVLQLNVKNSCGNEPIA